MKILVSFSTLSASYVVEFRASSGDATTVVDTDDGARLWYSDAGELEVASLTAESSRTARSILGPIWDRIVDHFARTDEPDAVVEFELDTEIPRTGAVGLPARTGAVDTKAPNLANVSADGVPREVPSGAPDLRAAFVDLPEQSGVEAIVEPRTAKVAWNPRSGEFRVQFAVVPGRSTSLWVRVAEGESGDLLALARPVSTEDGVATASTRVAHDGNLGDLYVDVTDTPLPTIGSSRLRVRRRAARLEAHAARLQSDGRRQESERFAAEAHRLRESLGESSPAVARGGSRRVWFLLFALVALAASFVLGRVLGGSSDDGAETTDGSVVDSSAPAPGVDDLVLAYSDGTTVFSGNLNASVAARVVTGEDANVTELEFQLNDRAEFVFGDGASPVTESAEAECRSGLFASTGSSGGGYSIPVDLVVLGAESEERAKALLTAATWDDSEVVGAFVGRVAMSANIVEDCVRRATPEGEKLFLVYRQVYEARTLQLNEPEGFSFVVVRLRLEDGSSIAWTSTEVMDATSGD